MTPKLPMSERQIEEQRQRAVLVKVLRGALVVLIVVVTALGIIQGATSGPLGVEFFSWWWVAVLIVLTYFAVIVGVDILTPKRKLSTISAILFGCFAGLIATAVLGLVIDLFVKTYEIPPDYDRIVLTAKVILGLGLCYIGITTVLQTQDDFRLVIPYVEFAKQFRGTRPLLIDTSVLIDGRILDVAEVGLLQAPLIVPRFVIDELQALSDSGDRVRRARGRRGLDLVSRLQRSAHVEVSVDDTEVPGVGVDQMLVELARSLPAIVVTTDSGLVRVAAIRGVTTININDLASALRPSAIAGDRISTRLVKPGEQPGQAVGYLEDGTLVVAENASALLDQQVDLIVTSTMQTSAGRLVFARPESESEAPDTSRSQRESLPEPEPDTEPPPEAPAPPAMPTGEQSGAGAGPLGPHKRKKVPGTPRNPRRA